MQFNPGVSLVLGGARSGKSTFAESLAGQSNRRKVYLATGEAWDDEMEQRIASHRQRRGTEWTAVEHPLEITQFIAAQADQDTCILVDCLTLWLTNLMIAKENVEERSGELVQILSALPANSSVLLVSNEVGQGIVPVEKMARLFRDHAGRLHQDIAAMAHNVWFVTAGLPQRLK